jgi:hypothetical protein
VADTSYASAFNPDYWAQTGLLMLGSPLLLTGFLLGGARSTPARPAPTTAPQQVAP